MATGVQAWFDRLPDHWQERAQRLRELILDAAPGIEEKLSYNIPFYHYRGWMCFINYAGDRLVLGFVRGIHMLDPEGLFSITDHKLIRHYLPPIPPARLAEDPFRRLVYEAIRTNVAIAETKRSKGRVRKR